MLKIPFPTILACWCQAGERSYTFSEGNQILFINIQDTELKH